MEGTNKETSAVETDTSTVTLPSQKFKSRKNLRLEGKIGKWQEAQSVKAPQIHTGSAMEAALSMSVSQAERFFAQTLLTKKGFDQFTIRVKLIRLKWDLNQAI